MKMGEVSEPWICFKISIIHRQTIILYISVYIYILSNSVNVFGVLLFLFLTCYCTCCICKVIRLQVCKNIFKRSNCPRSHFQRMWLSVRSCTSAWRWQSFSAVVSGPFCGLNMSRPGLRDQDSSLLCALISVICVHFGHDFANSCLLPVSYSYH